jgi:hypothetical protein
MTLSRRGLLTSCVVWNAKEVLGKSPVRRNSTLPREADRSRAIRASIDSRLREMYGELLQEPLPPEIDDLLGRFAPTTRA